MQLGRLNSLEPASARLPGGLSGKTQWRRAYRRLWPKSRPSPGTLPRALPIAPNPLGRHHRLGHLMVGHLPARSRPLYSRPVSRPQASLLLAPRTTEPALEGRSSEHARAIRRVQEEPRRPAKDIKRRGLSERRPAVVALKRTSASGPSFILSSHGQWCCFPDFPMVAHVRNFFK